MAKAETIYSELEKRAPENWDRLPEGFGEKGKAAIGKLANWGVVEIRTVDAVLGGGRNPWQCPQWRRARTEPSQG
jgi:hypothetical protein